MNRQFTYRHMEHTPAFEEFALKQLEQVEALLAHEPSPVFLHMVFTGAKDHAHQAVELLLKSPHYDLVAHHEGPDMYMEINHVIEMMVKEIKRKKEKLQDNNRNGDWYKGA